MSIVFLLAPFSVLLALIGLGAFWWTVDNGQYDDPLGDASRILIDDAEGPGEPLCDGDQIAPRPGLLSGKR